MNFLFSPMQRQAAGRALPSLSTTALTVFGFRLSRTQVLRISGILTLRTLLSAIPLPLDASVTSFIWSLTYSSIQTSLALAATASFFDWGGVLGALANRVFSGDKPFLSLYARVVVVVGPVVGIFETAVVVYEAMALARRLEKSMYRSEASGGKNWRRGLLGLTGVNMTAVCAMIWAVYATQPAVYAWFAACICGALLGTAVMCDDANVVEASLIGVYATTTLCVGLAEERDTPSAMLHLVLPAAAPYAAGAVAGLRIDAGSAETRAAVLVYTVGMLTVCMTRGRRFVRLVAVGHDALAAEEAAGGVGADAGRAGDGALKTGFGVVTMVAGTFRVLVWGAHVASGEYLPVLCRAVQMASAAALYAIFVRG